MKSEVVDQCSTDNTCFRIVEILPNFSLYCRKNRKESIINSSFKKRNCVKRRVQIEKYPSYLSEFRVSIIISVADQTHATNNLFFFSKKKKKRHEKITIYNFLFFLFMPNFFTPSKTLAPLFIPNIWCFMYLSFFSPFVVCIFLSSFPWFGKKEDRRFGQCKTKQLLGFEQYSLSTDPPDSIGKFLELINYDGKQD